LPVNRRLVNLEELTVNLFSHAAETLNRVKYLNPAVVRSSRDWERATREWRQGLDKKGILGRVSDKRQTLKKHDEGLLQALEEFSELAPRYTAAVEATRRAIQGYPSTVPDDSSPEQYASHLDQHDQSMAGIKALHHGVDAAYREIEQGHQQLSAAYTRLEDAKGKKPAELTTLGIQIEAAGRDLELGRQEIDENEVYIDSARFSPRLIMTTEGPGIRSLPSHQAHDVAPFYGPTPTGHASPPPQRRVRPEGVPPRTPSPEPRRPSLDRGGPVR
jgi:chromosome segregation ATPase